MGKGRQWTEWTQIHCGIVVLDVHFLQIVRRIRCKFWEDQTRQAYLLHFYGQVYIWQFFCLQFFWCDAEQKGNLIHSFVLPTVL